MRLIYLLVFTFVFIACNNRNSNKPGEKDTSNKKPDSIVNKPALPINSDSALMLLSEKILTAIKDTNYAALASYMHPRGVGFSPYGYIDTLDRQILSADALIELFRSNKKIYWGTFDGTGDPINMTASAYFKRFVYNVDFLRAPDRAINRNLGAGNSQDNISKVYPGSDFTEFHFNGFEKKYDGMDWASLRLVFKRENDKTWLIGIVHDEWTI